MKDDDGEVRGAGKDAGRLVDMRVPDLAILVHVTDLALSTHAVPAFPLVPRCNGDLALLVAEYGTNVFVFVCGRVGRRHVVEPLVMGAIILMVNDELVDNEEK